MRLSHSCQFPRYVVYMSDVSAVIVVALIKILISSAINSHVWLRQYATGVVVGALCLWKIVELWLKQPKSIKAWTPPWTSHTRPCRTFARIMLITFRKIAQKMGKGWIWLSFPLRKTLGNWARLWNKSGSLLLRLILIRRFRGMGIVRLFLL